MQPQSIEHFSFAVSLTPRSCYLVGAILIVTGAAVEFLWHSRLVRILGAIPLILGLALLVIGIKLHLQVIR